MTIWGLLYDYFPFSIWRFVIVEAVQEILEFQVFLTVCYLADNRMDLNKSEEERITALKAAKDHVQETPSTSFNTALAGRVEFSSTIAQSRDHYTINYVHEVPRFSEISYTTDDEFCLFSHRSKIMIQSS